MDTRVMELRIKQWIPLIEEQAKSGISKGEWCTMHGINRTSFFRWQKRVREYLLNQYDVPCEDPSSQLPLSTVSNEPGFVEIPSTQLPPVEMKGLAGQCAGDITACGRPSISIRYGGFAIDLGSGVDMEQLSAVLGVIKHAD